MRARTERCADGGWSLIELLTVVGILGILVGVAVASFSMAEQRSRRVACLHNQRLLDSAVVQYQIERAGLMPPNLDAVRPFVKWPGGNFGTCSSDPSVALTYDSDTGAIACPNHPR